MSTTSIVSNSLTNTPVSTYLTTTFCIDVLCDVGQLLECVRWEGEVFEWVGEMAQCAVKEDLVQYQADLLVEGRLAPEFLVKPEALSVQQAVL